MWNFIGEEGGKGKVRKIKDENGIEVYRSHPSESNNGMDEGYDSSSPYGKINYNNSCLFLFYWDLYIGSSINSREFNWVEKRTDAWVSWCLFELHFFLHPNFYFTTTNIDLLFFLGTLHNAIHMLSFARFSSYLEIFKSYPFLIYSFFGLSSSVINSNSPLLNS